MLTSEIRACHNIIPMILRQSIAKAILQDNSEQGVADNDINLNNSLSTKINAVYRDPVHELRKGWSMPQH